MPVNWTGHIWPVQPKPCPTLFDPESIRAMDFEKAAELIWMETMNRAWDKAMIGYTKAIKSEEALEKKRFGLSKIEPEIPKGPPR
jgi:hypothetical protein